MKPEFARPRRGGPRILLLVLLALAHLGLATWLNARQAKRGRAPAAALSVLRLDLPRRLDPARQLPVTTIAEPRLPLPVVVPIEAPRFEISNVNPPTQAPSPQQAAAAEAARPSPLNLALPSPPQVPQAPASAPQPYRNPALSDPRANTKRADYATRMADTLGSDGSLREEALGPGVHRFRQGTTCLEVSESRIALIDPFSNSMRPTPQLAKSCK